LCAQAKLFVSSLPGLWHASSIFTCLSLASSSTFSLPFLLFAWSLLYFLPSALAWPSFFSLRLSPRSLSSLCSSLLYILTPPTSSTLSSIPSLLSFFVRVMLCRRLRCSAFVRRKPGCYYRLSSNFLHQRSNFGPVRFLHGGLGASIFRSFKISEELKANWFVK
jgi:hypothetical protein